MTAKKKLANLPKKAVGAKKSGSVKGGSIIKKRDELQMSIIRKL